MNVAAGIIPMLTKTIVKAVDSMRVNVWPKWTKTVHSNVIGVQKRFMIAGKRCMTKGLNRSNVDAGLVRPHMLMIVIMILLLNV